jgi:hypothetical protein
MKLPLFGFCLSAAVLTGSIALAHHGWGSYDAGRVMTITGNVEQANWENPQLMVVVPHQGRSWEAVLAPPFRMSARGLNADMIRPGTQVRLEGYPSTRTATEMRAERIVVNGRTYELR